MIGMPPEFYECMRTTLGADYDEYISMLDSEPYRGLRVNTLKADDDTVMSLLGIKMKKTPFCDNGYYISNSIKGLGNHPLHHAGAFYLQEPSAMSAVSALEIRPGMKVLDLCAAPGGKSTQIAAALQGKGFLWSNEYVRKRASILASNLERCGVGNAVVSNCDTTVLCEELASSFDAVLVDAPCSGEGMIRREANAVSEWSLSNRAMCAERQTEILNNAAKAVMGGGTLVYSTCTLSGEENEQTVDRFLNTHPEFRIVDISRRFGRPAYSHFNTINNLSSARRIIYSDGGEGHFVVKMVKSGEDRRQITSNINTNKTDLSAFYEFYNDNFYCDVNAISFGDSVYIIPENVPIVKNLGVVRSGIYAGEIKKGRFVPAHHLYMCKRPSECKNVIALSIDDIRVGQFLHGFEIACESKGWCGVAVENIMLGFGKASSGMLKNHYPKGLRIC
ncbi:MAG: RsmB/NOP family class I SAM-dependent RNA methyltransferase [Clostridia bacterium]|nr:RsmB/NOP family class I SAM-dependent RNA methyltransferase [Clostridia bacterium]